MKSTRPVKLKDGHSRASLGRLAPHLGHFGEERVASGRNGLNREHPYSPITRCIVALAPNRRTAFLNLHYGAVGLPGIGGGLALEALMLGQGKRAGCDWVRAVLGRVEDLSMVQGGARVTPGVCRGSRGVQRAVLSIENAYTANAPRRGPATSVRTVYRGCPERTFFRRGMSRRDGLG